MKPSQFLNLYVLHDSFVEDIKYLINENKLELVIELCNWKQKFYTDTEPEMAKYKLVFKGVSKFEAIPNTLVDYDDILEVELLSSEMNNETVKFVLKGEEDVKILTVQAAEVDFIKLN
jgi:hypothetical protein